MKKDVQAVFPECSTDFIQKDIQNSLKGYSKRCCKDGLCLHPLTPSHTAITETETEVQFAHTKKENKQAYKRQKFKVFIFIQISGVLNTMISEWKQSEISLPANVAWNMIYTQNETNNMSKHFQHITYVAS